MAAPHAAEVERKAALGLPLVGDGKGNIDPQDLAYWQQLMTAKAAQQKADTSNQTTGGGVGTTTPQVIYVPTGTSYPGNDVVPSVTKDAVTGYGFTAIVGIGVAMIVVSLLSSFRRARGR